MRVVILSAFLIILVSAAPKENGAEDRIIAPVVPLSNSEILLACTNEIPFGKTLETAFAYCDKTVGENRIASVRLGKGKGKGKGNGGKGKGKGGKGGNGKGENGQGKAGQGKGGKKCPPVTVVLENLTSKAKKDSCVFRSIGWIDNDGDVIEDKMKIAITSLPAEVAQKMSVNTIKICAVKKAEEWAQTSKRKRCDATYNSSERSRLQKYAAKVAGMKCIKTVMSVSCRTFLDNTPATGVVAPVIIPQPILGSSSSEEEESEEEETSEEVESSKEEESSEEGGSSHSGETPILIPSSDEGGNSHSGEDSTEQGSSHEEGYSHSGEYSSEEAVSSEDGGGYSGHGGSSHEGGYSHSGGYSSEEAFSHEGGAGYGGHGGHGGYIGQGPPYTGLVQPYLPPPIAQFPLPHPPGQPLPFPIPQIGGGGNYQQVIVEQPQHPPPLYHPSPPLHGGWPSNLVAALLPADWVAQNLGLTGNDDDYEYGYDYEEYDYGEYYGGGDYYDYGEYGGDYVDYEDDAEQVND